MKRLVLALAFLLLFIAVPVVVAQDPTPTPAPGPATTFIRDAQWQFWGFVGTVVFGALALALAVILFRRQNNKKLVYEVLTDTTVISVKEEVKDKVKVLYEGQEIPRLDILEIKFTNVGSIPITPSDFFEEVKVTFLETTTVLLAAVTQTKPSDMNVAVSNTSPYTITRTLLNPKDWIVLKFLLSGGGAYTPKVSGRIVGGLILKSDRGKRNFIFSFLLPVGSLMAAFTLVLLNVAGNTFSSGYFLLLSLLAVLSALGIVSTTISLRNRDK